MSQFAAQLDYYFAIKVDTTWVDLKIAETFVSEVSVRVRDPETLPKETNWTL